MHPSRICAKKAQLAANRANQPTDWPARRSEVNAPYKRGVPHAPLRVSMETRSAEGASLPEYGLTKSSQLRTAALKARCNTNTFLSCDALPMGPSRACDYGECGGARDYITHRIYLCRHGPPQIAARQRYLQLLQIALEVPPTSQTATNRAI